jgi:uncharacterized protein YgbK (DUF1537 family)
VHLGVIADDFTGASDVANTLARGGLPTMQFLGLPSREAPTQCDAGVVALKTRSIPAPQAVAQSLAALQWLKRQGCRQFLFKYCSTFDSTPEGNIGPVGEALARELGAYGVPSCPAFPTAGRTVYQGHLFVGDKLLNESGLENHPLNPMTDPDIRRWLRKQSREPVGFVPWTVVEQGPQAIRSALAECAARNERLTIVDAIRDSDLRAIGEASADLPLLTGGSGIALGLPDNLFRVGLATRGKSEFRGVPGPEVVLAGSCSRATLGQIDLHRQKHPAFAVDIEAVMKGTITASTLARFANENRGGSPLIYSSASPDAVRHAQDAFGKSAVSAKLEHLFADTAVQLVSDGVRRMVVAGGETSGAVVSALGLKMLAIGPEIDPGVPALVSADDRPLALALKSGNFGSVEFFTKALRVLEAGHE